MDLSHHLLRLIVSCRKITAQVTLPRSNIIVAMACSSEREFSSDARARLGWSPRARGFWDPKIAVRVGEKLGERLKAIGVLRVEIDADEEMARPLHHRRPVDLLFQSVKRVGVEVCGVEKLKLS